MEHATLVVSDPPHRDEKELDLERVAELLGLDIYVTRLKSLFSAPEILFAGEPKEASDFAAALAGTGLSVAVVSGSLLSEPPWPEPAASLTLDQSGLRATVGEKAVLVPAADEVLAVYCRPPLDLVSEVTVEATQAVRSGFAPAVMEAIQWLGILDFYFREDGQLRRATVVPQLLDLDPDDVVADLLPRFSRLKLDSRLAAVRPRARFVMGEAGFDADKRKRYSFGTLLLCHLLESLDPDLRTITQYEYGSRLAYALGPLASP